MLADHREQAEPFELILDWVLEFREPQIDAGRLKFADAARDNSDVFDPATGGSIGWVANGQLKKELQDAIFAAPIGKVSAPLTIAGDGTYLFEVTKQETREPDADQKLSLENTVFADWYTTEKAKYTITRDASVDTGAES